MNKTKILLDTDIGTDVDDAVCLAYLLSHPDCDLLGITTVTGEAHKRAMLASAVCLHAGREVPIYPGVELPMVVGLKQQVAQQAVMLEKWPHATSFPSGEAVEFLRRTIRRYPGEIVLLTIAPLTNIGLLFSIDPEIPGLLKGLVMMCGRFLSPIPEGYGPLEWNAIGDPHASAIVYNASAAFHRSVGIDVTSKVSMTAQEFREIFRSKRVMQPVMDFAEVWFKEYPGTTFHDPLAGALIFEPSLCTFDRGKVVIDLLHSESLGLTGWNPLKDGPHQIASSVDANRYFSHFTSIVSK